MDNISLNRNAMSGVYEIDANGILIYSSVKSVAGSIKHTYDPQGIQFFQDIAKFKNASDLHDRFDLFRAANIPTESFNFTCKYDETKETIRVLLARLVDRPGSCSFLVYIRHNGGSPV